MGNTFEAQTLLQDVISRLRKAKQEEALSELSRARKDIIKEISLHAITPEMHDLIFNLYGLTYLGMLHYSFIGHETTKNSDNVAKLTCLSQSLGISNIIEAVFLPMLSTAGFGDKQNLLPLTQHLEYSREELHKEICQLVDSIRGSKEEKERQYAASIKKIIEAVNPGSYDVRTLAVQLGHRFEAGNFKQARRIYEYVRDEIHYMRDPLPFEDIQSPETTLKRSSGDCEDQAILLCSLLLAIGFESALLFTDSDGDGISDHVYSAVRIPEAPDLYKPFANKRLGERDLHNWIPMDPTSEDLDFGVITLDNLELKQACFFLKDGQQYVDVGQH